MTDDARSEEPVAEWRDVAAAADLLARATPEDRAAAEKLMLDQLSTALRGLGFALHRVPIEVARIRSNDTALRIQSETDYVLHDATLAAGVVRAHLRRTGESFRTCLTEPIEEDEAELLTEIFFQQIPVADCHGAVEIVGSTVLVRSLTDSERASGRHTPAEQLKGLFGSG